MNTGPLATIAAERIVPDSWEAWQQFRDALMTGERSGIYIGDMPRLERAYVLLRDRGVFDIAYFHGIPGPGEENRRYTP